MRKMVLLVVMVALAAMMLAAAPASAQTIEAADLGFFDEICDNDDDDRDGFIECEDLLGLLFDDFDEFDEFFGFGVDFVDFGDVEQEAETGDIDQSFTVTNTGDNSNQCAGIQGVANTGSNQNFTVVQQTGNFEPDIEVEEFGEFTVSPESETSCVQEVNQAAVAN